jgi:hypothetical protein
MKRKIFSRQFLCSATMMLVYLALVKFFIHFFTNLAGGYGYFRDEFYYLACSEHLALGYVDQPPLSIVFLWVQRLLLGDSLVALRFLPAVAGALLVLITGLITRELGGNRFAQTLSALAVIAAPIYLSLNNFYSMNSFDLLFWVLLIFLFIKIIKTENNKWWLILGIVIGLGLLNKISMLWLGFGLFIGMIITPLRKYFLSRGPWLAAAIACVLFLPHIIWQFVNGWPTLEFMHNATTMKMVIKSPLDFILGQILIINPASLPLWLLGLAAYFFTKKLKRFRILAWIYLSVLLLLVFNGASRDYYLAAAYPMLFASGAIVTEEFIIRHSWNWIKPLLILYLIIGGFIIAPLAIPIIPVEKYISYAEWLGMAPSQEERHVMGKLPQHYADMHGWPEMVQTLAGVYSRLTPEEQKKTAIFAGNYGEAGAIDFFGRQYHLPRSICAHNNYWIWGPGENVGAIVIILGGDVARLKEIFEQVERVDLFICEYCMPYESNLPIFLARELKVPISQLWPSLKHYH